MGAAVLTLRSRLHGLPGQGLVTARRVVAAVVGLAAAGCGQEAVPVPEPVVPTTAPPAPPETTTTTEAEPETTTTTVVVTPDEPLVVHPATTLPTWRPRPEPALPSPQGRTTRQDDPFGGWEIPRDIVMCESGGAWGAENASGAAGPYQLMPEHFGGESALNQTCEAQHAKARQLWNGGKGASNWAECL